MTATTTQEREVLDLQPIEREAQPIAVQQTGAIAAQSPMGMMLAAMGQGVHGKPLNQLIARVEKSFAIPEWFSYVPETGAVLWMRSPSRKVRVGTPAGTPCGKGKKKVPKHQDQGWIHPGASRCFFLVFWAHACDRDRP